MKQVITKKIYRELTSSFFDIPEDILFSKTRKRTIAECRFMGMYWLVNNTKKLSYIDVAEWNGKTDHSTINHAIRKHKDLCEVDLSYNQRYFEYEKHMLKYHEFIGEKIDKELELITQKIEANKSVDLIEKKSLLEGIKKIANIQKEVDSMYINVKQIFHQITTK